MLDSWIIEELKKREESLKREREALYVELPVYADPSTDPKTREVEESQRGIVVIDI